MDTFTNALLATLLVSTVSFIGVFVLLKNTLTPLTTAMISFAAGTLVGDAFLHLLPEHIETFGYSTKTVAFIFGGILIMLIIEAYFHCSHDSSEEIEHHEHSKKGVLANLNIIGDGMHNFLDGLAIASSFLISPAVGFSSTIAIILHEIPQELADASILSYSGWKRKKILIFNFLTALTALLGVLFVYVVKSKVDHAEQYLVPLAIGQFIYISLADLLPEIHKKSGVKKYILEIGMFIGGLLVMYLLTLAE